MSEEEYVEDVLEIETESEVDELYAVEPVKVELCSPVVTIDTVPQHVSCFTIVLTADEPVQKLMDLDPLRHEAIVISLDQDVVLCHSYQQAQDPANVTAALPRPNGYILSGGAGFPPYVVLETTAHLWVAAPVTGEETARISCIVKRLMPGGNFRVGPWVPAS
jgi:hypothetical protein